MWCGRRRVRLILHACAWRWLGPSSGSLHGAAPQDQAVGNSLSMLSVGCRLGLEDSHLAGLENCYDEAEWLIDIARGHLGTTLRIVGGESAKAHLTLFDA